MFSKVSLFVMVLVAIVYGSAIGSADDQAELLRRSRPRIVTSLTTDHGARQTVVTSRGGQAITLAEHGTTTRFAGKIYTVKPTPHVHTNVYIVPTPASHHHNHHNHHNHKLNHKHSAHEAKVTVVTQNGGAAITLADHGVKTVFGGKTYTVAKPTPTHRRLDHKNAVGHHHKHKHGHKYKHAHHHKHKHGHKHVHHHKHKHGHKHAHHHKHKHGHKHEIAHKYKHNHGFKHTHKHQHGVHTSIKYLDGRPATVLAQNGHSITLARYGGHKTVFAGATYMATATPAPYRNHRVYNREIEEIEQRDFEEVEARELDGIEQREVDGLEQREEVEERELADEVEMRDNRHEHKHKHKKNHKHGHKHNKHHKHKHVIYKQGRKHVVYKNRPQSRPGRVQKVVEVHNIYQNEHNHKHGHKHEHKHGHKHNHVYRPPTKTVYQHGATVTLVQAPNDVVVTLAPTGTVTRFAGATYTIVPNPVKNIRLTHLFALKKNSASSTAAASGLFSVALAAIVGIFFTL